MQHTDSERDTDDDDDDTGHGNPQVLPNKPECYEQLIVSGMIFFFHKSVLNFHSFTYLF